MNSVLFFPSKYAYVFLITFRFSKQCPIDIVTNKVDLMVPRAAPVKIVSKTRWKAVDRTIRINWDLFRNEKSSTLLQLYLLEYRF